MKQNFLTFALLILIGPGATAFAQTPGRGAATMQERLERHLERLDEALSLTDAQEAQVRALLQQHQAQNMARMQGRVGARDSVLTEDQRATLRQHRQKMAEERRALRGSLNLSDEQRAAMREQRRNRADAQRTERRARMEAMGAERERMHAQIEAVLTPEQRERFEQFQAEQREKMMERRPGLDRPRRGNR